VTPQSASQPSPQHGTNPEFDAYWMPFTPNRYFKSHPKLVTGARGAYYMTMDGRRVFDALSGMWCCPLGHAHPRIIQALTHQAETLDYSPAFQIGSPITFSFANRIAQLAPADLSRVFFSNSGSEAVDSAIKIAIAYHRARGDGTRTRLIGRERAYHGVGMAGLSLGGIGPNRKAFPSLSIVGADHLPHTYDRSQMAFTKGEPTWGAHLADDLERLVTLHDASNIAAVVVEPMQGSTGVIVPPVGYLKKLREICTKHGILLIFDEVITGFGRLGTAFAADRVEVVPDMIAFAKAVTNGVVPLGGVIVRDGIYETLMAAAVGHATLDVMEGEGLFEQARELEPVLADAVHSLRGEPGVLDIRNFGLAAAVDLEPIANQPGLRGFKVFEHAFENGQLLRLTGDTIAMGPPFISKAFEIEKMIEDLRTAIRATH
jgi:beta-alanine--pyruvate transaminase